MSGILEFGRPDLFWLLALLPLLWIRYRSQPVMAILWRSVVLVLVLAALADPRSVKPSPMVKSGDRVFAFDVSRSVPGDTRRWMARQERLPAIGDRVFIFAGAPEETRDWKRQLEAPGEGVKPERTNLEALFAVLLKLPREERSVFLFTDGWENDGSAERLLPALAQAGIRVYPILPPERPAVPNVVLKKVVAPGEIGRGEALNLKIAVENGNRREVDGAIVLKRAGRPIRTEAVKLRPGSQLLNYQAAVGEEPLQSFEAEFTPRERGVDVVPSDNRATAWVAVQAKEKALVVNGRSGEGRYVEELLRRRGFEVISVAVGGSLPTPADYGIVILNNVDKDRLPAAYFTALERYASGGGGLVVLGDSTALTPAYRQTPIAAALPVEFSEPKEKTKEPEKTRAVLLVIDKSSSMDPNINPYKENRILYAKEIAKRVISQLGDDDFIGVIGFDTAPFPIVQIDTVRRLRPSFAREIDRLVPKGNTEVIPALREAMIQLQRQPADSKFVILITDADHVGGRPSEYTDLVTRMRNEQNIIVSAVGIGRGVDEALVKRIGTYGGGKSHIARNMNDFPTFEFERAPKTPPTPPKAQAQDFKPLVAESSEILPAFAATFPTVRGYVESELKRDARLDLMVQSEGKNHPLLASWNYGKGKVAVLTIDQSGRWSRDWIAWSGLQRFWGRVFDWLKPQRDALPPHEARINQSGDQVVLDFYLYSAEFDGDPFRYGYTGPRGARGDGMLKRVAAGHYQAALPLGAAGDYRIELKEERHGRTINYPPLGYTRQAETTAEVPTADLNLALLERISGVTGGAINPANEPQRQQDKLAPEVKPLHAYLILAAALLFLAERFIRMLLMHAA